MSDNGWASANNLLCVRLDSMGDVLLTTPAIAALKRNRAGRRITLLTSGSGAEAARLVPEIDEVIIYEAPWMKATQPCPTRQSDHAMLRRLASAGFDGAAIFTVYSQNPLPAALFCYLAEIPLRLAHCRENPYELLTDWIRDPEPQDFVRHEVRRHLDLVASVGVEPVDDRLRLRVPGLARRRMHCLLDAIRRDAGAPWVVIHPGSTAASRRYPAEKFADVADGLATQGFEIVFTGDQTETALITSIQKQMWSPTHSLAGKLNLAELAALIEASPILICNNTGPVHVAAAVGTPVVDLYALTNPQHTPWRVPHRVLFHDVPCKYCYKSVCPEGHHDCLRRVAPQAVVQATLELLDETGGQQGLTKGSGFRVQRAYRPFPHAEREVYGGRSAVQRRRTCRESTPLARL